jgi:hypothetical protein
MANTLPSLTLIADKALPVLTASVPFLGAFSTDFSDQVATQGTAIATRIPAAMTPTAFSNVTGYVGQDVSPTAVTVTLNQHYYNQVSFTDAEVANLGLDRLVNTFVGPMIKGLVKKVGDDIYGLITTGNYPVTAYTGTTYTFPNLVQAPMASLIASGVGEGKAIVLNPTAYYGLVNDVKANSTIGDLTTIRDGILPNLGGAAVVRADALPSTSNLFGFACGQSAIAIAARVPNLEGVDSALGEIVNVTDASSKFTVQLRKWYSFDRGLWQIAAVAIYGFSKGNANALARLVTA